MFIKTGLEKQKQSKKWCHCDSYSFHVKLTNERNKSGNTHWKKFYEASKKSYKKMEKQQTKQTVFPLYLRIQIEFIQPSWNMLEYYLAKFLLQEKLMITLLKLISLFKLNFLVKEVRETSANKTQQRKFKIRKSCHASNEQNIEVVFDIYGIMHLDDVYKSLLQRHLSKISLQSRNIVKTSFLVDEEKREPKWFSWRVINFIGMVFRPGKIQETRPTKNIPF